MNRQCRQQVLAIARAVRPWAEQRDIGLGRGLCGMCARASAELWYRLDAAGIPAGIRVHDSGPMSHVFVVVDDWVVDVTATQFDQFRNHPIVMLHTREAESYTFYQADAEFDTARDLIRYQEFTSWPRSQIAQPRQ